MKNVKNLQNGLRVRKKQNKKVRENKMFGQESAKGYEKNYKKSAYKKIPLHFNFFLNVIMMIVCNISTIFLDKYDSAVYVL